MKQVFRPSALRPRKWYLPAQAILFANSKKRRGGRSVRESVVCNNHPSAGVLRNEQAPSIVIDSPFSLFPKASMRRRKSTLHSFQRFEHGPVLSTPTVFLHYVWTICFFSFFASCIFKHLRCQEATRVVSILVQGFFAIVLSPCIFPNHGLL